MQEYVPIVVIIQGCIILVYLPCCRYEEIRFAFRFLRPGVMIFIYRLCISRLYFCCNVNVYLFLFISTYFC